MDSIFLWLPITTPTLDILLIFFFLISGFFYGLFSGRARLLAFTIALYAGIAISSASTLFTHSLPDDTRATIHISIFVASSIINSMAIFSSLLKSRRLGSDGWWQVFVLSFFSMGLVVSFVARTLTIALQQKFTDLVVQLFISDIAYAVWLILPLTAIIFASRRVE